ncbi:MAG: hypothetical protein LBF88_05270 [Planctomycetaceae bacterium]|jgi:hypothetical protein|nr:hypothetical protein [Planctomycetaceae bacterium]
MKILTILFLFFATTLNCVFAKADDGLTLTEFSEPAGENRPWAFWVWQNGNITKEGITADLEAMKKVGIGGALIMELGYGNIPPRGPADFLSDQWRELFAFMLSEANRLGLEINMFASAAFGGGGGSWIKPEHSMLKIVWSEKQVTENKVADNKIVDNKIAEKQVADNKLKQPPTNLNFYRDIAVLAFPTPPDADKRQPVAIPGNASFPMLSNPQIDKNNPVVAKNQIVDITDKMKPDGTLQWTPPDNTKYTVLRIGYTSAGTKLLPPPISCKDALECDKLSVEAAEIFFNGQIQRLVNENKNLAGKTFVGTHIDSWEVGSQNWTPKMREEFQEISHYDIIPYLPVFAGYQIDSPENTQRFLWDFRNTVSQLVIKNYAGTIQRLANKNGMAFSIEAYDGAPCDFLQYGGVADQPTGEFWTQRGNHNLQHSMRGMASAAHVYGKNIVPSEAFTAFPNERWTTHPATFKPLGDLAFCEGTNRMIFHAVTHQPRAGNIAPGLMYYKWGSHYERTQSWWNQSADWHRYLARCQLMLRQGSPVADIAFLEPEIVPQKFTNHPRGSFLWDHINLHALKSATVNNGQIILPSGMTYNVLVTPNTDCWTLSLVQTIERLAESGATIIAMKIPKRTPNLADYVDDEKQIEKIMTKLLDGKKIIVGKTVENVLREKGIEQDFVSTSKLSWTHRRTANGTDIYFVANTENVHVNTTAIFRSENFPELWNPLNGKRIAAPSYVKRNGKTMLFLPLKANESMFVVFPKTPTIPPVENPVVGVEQVGVGQDNVERDRVDRDRVEQDNVERVDVGQDRVEQVGQVLFSISKAKESRLKILQAIYGPANVPAQTIDVTEAVRQLTMIDESGFNVSEITAICGDPAPNVVKRLTVQFELDGVTKSASANDGGFLVIAGNVVKDSATKIQLPVFEFDFDRQGIETLQIRRVGNYVLRTADNTNLTKTIKPVIIPLNGEWTLTFPNQKTLTLQKLNSWTESEEEYVKYFSGTAAYSKTVQVDFDLKRNSAQHKNERLIFDLGNVYEIAEIFIDGEKIGTLWHGEKRIDITEFVVKKKSFRLEIRVTNLLQNRLIGDQFIEEVEVDRKNGVIQKFPQWYLEGKPIPGGRSTFSSWELYNKQDQLLPSGLLGPVVIEYQ